MADPDVLHNGKTIYEVTKWEIFSRNFIAGFARGLGNFLFTILIFILLTALTAQLLAPYLGTLTQSLESFNSIMGSLGTVQGRLGR